LASEAGLREPALVGAKK